MKSSVLLFIVLLLTLSGCATSRGFNRGELRQEMNGKAAVTDADVDKALAAKAQLPKPFKIGVFFKEADATTYRRTSKWRWTEDDKGKILSLAEKLKQTGEVAEVFPISDATITGTDLKSLRLAAARHGADALLIVSGISDLDSYTNDWAWTYIALVPALFVPATVNDALFMTKASMWDVRNEFLYATAETESMKKQVKPAAFSDDRKVTDEAKNEAIDKLRDELSKMISSLAEKRASTPKKKM